MYFSRSLLASAIVLSLSSTIQARVAHHKVDFAGSDASNNKRSGLSGIIRELLGKRQDSSEIDCTPNVEWNILNAAASGDTQTFCNQWLAIPPATTETDITPIVTRWSTDANTDLKTSTSRTTTTATETVMMTATVTAAPMVRRAVNAQLRYNAANAIFESVLASGTESASPSTTPLNSEQMMAQAGMSTACLCMDVDPTSTVTSTFTAPAQQTVMRKFVLRLETTVVTRSFTATTTITQGTDETAAQTSTIASDSLLSSGFSTGALSATVLTSSAFSVASSASIDISTFDPQTTGTIMPTIISSGGGAPSLASNPTRLVATALPFDCPSSNGNSITNVVGTEMYEYTVMCDTAVVTNNEILTIQLSSATDCAVECSFVNDAFQKEVCQAATFNGAPGASVGDCLISGETSTYVDRPGSTTVVLKAVYSSGENCSVLDFANGPANATVDSSAIISSIEATSVPVVIPGLVTTSAAGGVFRTYVSAGETDSVGIYRYSWYEIYASSSYWGAVYKTSWSCTNQLPPRTIVVQHPFTTVGEDQETTIIDGGTTYIVSGTFTRRVTAGNGAATPTAVAASTTGGGAAFATGFSTATQTGTAGNGVQFPPVIQAGNNQTLVIGGTAAAGSAVFSTGSIASTFNSTGNGGAITPSPSGTGLPALNLIGGLNVTVTVTSAVTVVLTTGGAGATIIGSTATSNFTNGGGSLGPSANASFSNAEGDRNGRFSTGAPTPPVNSAPSGAAQFTISAGFSTFNVTGGFGTGALSQASGGAALTISGGTSTSNVTGGFGTGILAQASGAAELTVIRGTSVGFATGGGGSILPSATNGSFVGPSITSGGAEASQAFSTATSNFTEGGGYGRPVDSTGLPATSGGVEFATSGSQVFIVGGATSTSNFTGGAGTGLPSAVLAASISVISGSAQLSEGGNTSVFFSTGGGGAITPLPLTLNGTAVVRLSTGGVAAFSTFAGTAVTSATGGSGFISPNATTLLAPSATPSPSINATSTGPTFANTDLNRSGAFSRVRTTNATISGTAPIGTAPPSITVPPVSANATASPSTNITDSFSEGDREGFYSRSRSTGGSAEMPIPTANITLWPGTSVPETASEIIPTASANSTELPLGTGSSSLPEVSANSTAGGNTASIAFATATSNVTFGTGVIVPPANATFSDSQGTGRYRGPLIIATAFSTGVPIPSANSTGSFSLGGTAVSSGAPTPSANGTFSNIEDNRSGAFFRGTAVSSAVPTPSTNATFSNSEGNRSGAFSRGTAASTAVAAITANSTGFFPTGTGSSSTACLFTAPVVRTILETTVITRLVTETPTACPTNGNATIPTGTAPLQPSSTLDTLSSSAPVVIVSRRVSNVIATPEQITAACASRSNILYNSGLELQDDNNLLGWSSVPQDQFISFRTFPTTNQHSVNGSQSGRILSAAAGRSIAISQPVTLCPGQQYQLSSWNRQQNLLSQCTLEYWIGEDRIFTASPQTSWLERSEFFTAGATSESASVEFTIRGSCQGSAGAPVGTDESGFMIVEFNDPEIAQV